VLPATRQRRFFPPLPQPKLVLDLATPKGCKAELTCVQEWHDEYLTWDPALYDGVAQLVLAPTEIWLPDIGIKNRSTEHSVLAGWRLGWRLAKSLFFYILGRTERTRCGLLQSMIQ